MGEKGTGDKPEPTLELPSLRPSFRRRKRALPAAPEDVSASPEPPAPSGRERRTAPTAVEPVVKPSPTDAATPDDTEPRTEGSPATPGTRRRARSGPLLPALTAVVLTGLLVGLVGAGATFGGLQACEAARGTPSCGGPGLVVLVVIVVAMMLLGAVLLRSLQVAEPRGVSFLGVGLLCVIVLVGLIDALLSPWMFLVVPALTALTFAVGRWVTTRFVEPTEHEPGYDVR